MSLLSKLKNGTRILRKEGVAGIQRSVRYHRKFSRQTRDYQKWIQQYDTLTEPDVAEIRHRISALKYRPLISVVMPVYNTPEKWLRIAITSVREQIYENWELCIADDNSTDPAVRRVLDEHASVDERIRITFRRHNGHISAASNSALQMASGDIVVLLDHDDELAPYAFSEIAFEISRYPNANMIYSDEDIISETGRRYMPKFKPDWSPDLFYSMNLVTHLAAYRTNLVKELGGFREGFEGSQDYDLALRVIERIPGETIRHIPRILYHWRAVQGSAATGVEAKPYAYERARRAINEHFLRTGTNAVSVEAPLQINRTAYRLPEPLPAVTVIVSLERNAIRSLKGIADVSYPGTIEVIACVAGEGETGPVSENVKLCFSNETAHFSRLNAAAASAVGNVLCFLDRTSRPAGVDWLQVLVGYATQPKIGAVGAKLLFSDKTIKNAGYVFGVGNGIGRSHYRSRSDNYGNYMRLVVDQNVSAISSECMVIHRSVFDELGGFNASDYPNYLADIDLCFRLQRAGYRITWTPWVEIVQDGENDRRSDREMIKLRDRWPEVFVSDPFYNPNLTPEKEDLSLAFPPRIARWNCATSDTI